MSLPAPPDAFAAWESRPAESLDAFQLIADAITHIGGFGVAAISVVRGSHLVVEAISGSDQAREQLSGARTPIANMLQEIAHADDWGSFRFLPHDRIDPDIDNLGWVPEVEPLDAEDAWHPLDLLVAPLFNGDRLIGMLSIDLPGDGRRPGKEQRRLLDEYAAQAARAVLAALDHEALAEQVRLAEAAREIVRSMSTELTMETLLAACNEAMSEGFGAAGLWLQTFDAVGRPGSGRVWAPKGVEIDIPDEVKPIAEASAFDAWRRQSVDVVTVGEENALLPPRARDLVYDFLRSIDVVSMLFVPLGAGQDCVGALVMTRGPDDPEWSPVEVSAARDIGLDVGRAVLNARTFERERELVSELQALDTYKTQLISTLGHELKNPLTAISAHLELIGEASVEPDTRFSLDAIERGARRLSRIVDDLMMLAKVGDPDTPLVKEAVDISAIVDEVVDMFSVSAVSGAVELRTDYADGPLHVLGDAAELDHVVANLVGNAVKYTPGGGSVTVTLSRIADEVALEVVDTGIGISAEDQEQLFTEFFRSRNPQAIAQPGTGLGLTIAARIVDRHGGRLHMTSELGAGSTFRVVLPAAEPLSDPAEPAQPSKQAPSKV
jgi:signal transduction histidine kinase